MVEVVQIDAAPVPVDELLMGGAIAGGTGDVGGEDGNALSEEMLVETRTGSGALLSLWAAVNGQQHRCGPSSVGKVERGVDVALFSCRISDHLRLGRLDDLQSRRAGVSEIAEMG